MSRRFGPIELIVEVPIAAGRAAGTMPAALLILLFGAYSVKAWKARILEA